MQSTGTTEAKAETAAGILGVITGLGVVTFALFPLALPTLILLGVFLVPLLPVAIVGALLAAAWLGVRAVARRVGGRRARERATRPGVSISPGLHGQLR